MFAAVTFICCVALASAAHPLNPIPAVTTLNLGEYLGLWYQMYSNPVVLASFQKGAFCATALYGDNGDGTVSVYNYETVDSPTGNVTDIYGYAYIPDATKPGEFMVHLDGVPHDAAYWVLALGPVFKGLYDWAIVSDNLSVTVFILARDYNRFDAIYSKNVLDLAHSMGFVTIDVYQADDCVYASTTRAKHIRATSSTHKTA